MCEEVAARAVPVDGLPSSHPALRAQAVRDGRWVLIEDIDRAPFDVLSTLIPLLETRTLPLPSRGVSIVAADGFRLFGTRSTPPRAFDDSAGGGDVGAGAGGGSVTGHLAPFVNLWCRVALRQLPRAEMRMLLSECVLRMRARAASRGAARSRACAPAAAVVACRGFGHLPVSVIEALLGSYAVLHEAHARTDHGLGHYGRSLSPRDLVKCASRICNLSHISVAGGGGSGALFVTERVRTCACSRALP